MRAEVLPLSNNSNKWKNFLFIGGRDGNVYNITGVAGIDITSGAPFPEENPFHKLDADLDVLGMSYSQFKSLPAEELKRVVREGMDVKYLKRVLEKDHPKGYLKWLEFEYKGKKDRVATFYYENVNQAAVIDLWGDEEVWIVLAPGGPGFPHWYLRQAISYFNFFGIKVVSYDSHGSGATYDEWKRFRSKNESTNYSDWDKGVKEWQEQKKRYCTPDYHGAEYKAVMKRVCEVNAGQEKFRVFAAGQSYGAMAAGIGLDSMIESDERYKEMIEGLLLLNPYIDAEKWGMSVREVFVAFREKYLRDILRCGDYVDYVDKDGNLVISRAIYTSREELKRMISKAYDNHYTRAGSYDDYDLPSNILIRLRGLGFSDYEISKLLFNLEMYVEMYGLDEESAGATGTLSRNIEDVIVEISKEIPVLFQTAEHDEILMKHLKDCIKACEDVGGEAYAIDGLKGSHMQWGMDVSDRYHTEEQTMRRNVAKIAIIMMKILGVEYNFIQGSNIIGMRGEKNSDGDMV